MGRLATVAPGGGGGPGSRPTEKVGDIHASVAESHVACSVPWEDGYFQNLSAVCPVGPPP